MAEGAEEVARQAYAGFAAGDTAVVLSLVAEDLEWTFFDPSAPDPEPAVCRGRDQLAYSMGV
jgi:ketosteroid isomerase-like protein